MMCGKKVYVLISLIALLALLLSGSVYASVQSARTASPVCGNGVIESGEQCDGADLGGQSCMTRGFFGGSLSCNSNCTFNTSSCTSGGGGGGGGGVPGVFFATAIFRGKAYPGSDVTFLKDAQVAATTRAGADANFEISLSNLISGTYTFGVWAEDSKGNRSLTHTFTLSVSSGASTVVSGIFLPPTISVDKKEVKRGEILTFLGQSAPESQITVIINSEEEIVKKTNSGKDGLWILKMNSGELDMGDHSARGRASLQNDLSVFSQVVFFKVGTKTVLAEQKSITFKKADPNLDGRVNLIDFSILAYWYKRPLSDSAREKVDLNSDGKVDLIDFSIMAFHWTG